MPTTAEVAVQHAARMQEGQPFSNLQSSLQNSLLARPSFGVGGRPEQALVNSHLCITWSCFRAEEQKESPTAYDGLLNHLL